MKLYKLMFCYGWKIKMFKKIRVLNVYTNF